MGRKTVRAVELILDWNLWPRHEANGVDVTNVNRMVTALQAGVDLPPVIVNSADMRVIDGFHRLKAHLKAFGSDAKMTVDMRVYETEADMFQDSVRYNAQHGLPLTPKDRAHALIKARKFKIPYSAMASALGMTEAKVKDFLAKRTAKTESGETVALSYGASDLAGKVLTPAQEHFNDHSTGSKPIMYASMLVNALDAEALPLDQQACSKLRELYNMIGGILDGACHE